MSFVLKISSEGASLNSGSSLFHYDKQLGSKLDLNLFVLASGKVQRLFYLRELLVSLELFPTTIGKEGLLSGL